MAIRECIEFRDRHGESSSSQIPCSSGTTSKKQYKRSYVPNRVKGGRMTASSTTPKTPSNSGSRQLTSPKILLFAMIPIVFAWLVYSWPLYPQTPLSTLAVKAVCAGRIYTANEAKDIVGCFAYSPTSKIFMAVGTRESILKQYPDIEIRELRDEAVLPGLYDSHGHIMQYGVMQENVNLFGANSFEEIHARIRDWLSDNKDVIPKLKSGKKWLIGYGWDQNILPRGKYPTAHDLDIPELDGVHVKFYRTDVHCLWVSNSVLDLLDLPEEIPGGEIIRDPGLGVLCDTAATLVENISPKPTDEERTATLKKAMKSLNSVGLVGVHDAGAFPEEISLYKRMADAGELSLRIYAMVSCPPYNGYCRDEIPYLENYNDGFLSVRSVKIFTDGALGSWGAYMIEDYSDKPGARGSSLLNYTQLESLVRRWYEVGFQVNVHAIGDLANRQVIQAFNAVLPDDTIPRNQKIRFRIEHAQIIHPDDVILAQNLGIVMSMQPTHATSDMSYALSRLGPERLAHGAYAQATFARNPNTTLVLGSDFPVEPPSPLRGIYAAVTRLDPDTGTSPHGPGGWYPEQKLTFEEALAGFTRDAAYGAFQEDDAGSIEVGKWADWVVVGEKSEGIVIDGIVKETWVGGRRVF